MTRTGGRKRRHSDRGTSTRCYRIQLNVKRSGCIFHCDHYLGHGSFFLNRFWLLGSHEVDAALERQRHVFPFARAVDGGRNKPGPSINSQLPKFFQVETSPGRKTGPKICALIPDRVVLLNFERVGRDGIGAIVPVIDYIKGQSRETPTRTPNRNRPEYQRSTSES